jgi:hypothetical protein
MIMRKIMKCWWYVQFQNLQRDKELVEQVVFRGENVIDFVERKILMVSYLKIVYQKY